MSELKKNVNKFWVFGAAAATIVGSASLLGIAMNQNAFAATTMHSAVKHNQSVANPPESSDGYTVINESANIPSQPTPLLLFEWKSEGITTQQQIDQKYHEWIAKHTAGATDMSAQQAAAYAAPIVKNAYNLNLKGYTAKAQFQADRFPNSSDWVVTFVPPSGSTGIAEDYNCFINGVTGSFMDMEVDMPLTAESTTNVNYPSWVIPTAKQDISKFLPKNVSITSTKIVGHKTGFLYIVSNLSNGSAFGVALSEQTKFAFWYHAFPNGYDGFWDGYND